MRFDLWHTMSTFYFIHSVILFKAFYYWSKIHGITCYPVSKNMVWLTKVTFWSTIIYTVLVCSQDRLRFGLSYSVSWPHHDHWLTSPVARTVVGIVFSADILTNNDLWGFTIKKVGVRQCPIRSLILGFAKVSKARDLGLELSVRSEF